MKVKNNYKSLAPGMIEQLYIVLKSMIVGLIAGAVSVFYRVILGYAEHGSIHMYEWLSDNLVFLPAVVIGFFCIAVMISFMLKRDPMISGSGIPQVEGILKGYFTKRQSWLSTLVLKFCGGALGIAAGLSLGREGPSIQLGASVGEGVAGRLSKSRFEKKILMASGASAGLAAAFNAPLAGVMFALEEVFKYFTPFILLSMMSAAVASDFISKYIFGLEPIFRFVVVKPIPLPDYGYVIGLGILLGVLGAFYNSSLIWCKKQYEKIKTGWIRIMIPLVLAVILGLFMPQVLGGGHQMLPLLEQNVLLRVLIVSLIVKFLFSMISFGSGTPGGIFFPLIIMGAGIGAAYAQVVTTYLGLEKDVFNNFIILAMAGYFTAIVRAPITGIILVTEMTNSLTHLLSLTVVSVIAFVTADLLKSTPVYEALLDAMIDGEEENAKESGQKIVFEMVVRHNSLLENKHIRDISLTDGALIVEVRRGERNMIARGATKILSGDVLTVLTDISFESAVRAYMENLTEERT